MPTEKEYQEAIVRQEDELTAEQQKVRKLTKGQMSLFDTFNDENLIRWQLDLKEDLDRIYHLLRGDFIKVQDDGSISYSEQTNPELKPFNEFGVQIILNVLSFYLNRNTILSNYDVKTIDWKILDLGNELADLIHNRYQEMMTTIEQGEDEKLTIYEERLKVHLINKLKLYPLIVKELVDTIHSAYLRALGGGERRELRTARTVTQSDSSAPQMSFSQPTVNKMDKRSVFRPSTWVKRI